MDPAEGLIWLLVFVFSTTLHEASHAAFAFWGGDSTAYHGGQVSLDPIPHLRREPFGMLILPILSLYWMGWPLGYASAPYDPDWARSHPGKASLMSLAGPLSNFFLVLLSVILIWIGIALGIFMHPPAVDASTVVFALEDGMAQTVALFISALFTMNIVLFVFNLLPLPPLDGAGVLLGLLREDQVEAYQNYTAHPMMSILGIFLAWQFFGKIFHPVFLFLINLIYPGVHYG